MRAELLVEAEVAPLVEQVEVVVGQQAALRHGSHRRAGSGGTGLGDGGATFLGPVAAAHVGGLLVAHRVPSGLVIGCSAVFIECCRGGAGRRGGGAVTPPRGVEPPENGADRWIDGDLLQREGGAAAPVGTLVRRAGDVLRRQLTPQVLEVDEDQRRGALTERGEGRREDLDAAGRIVAGTRPRPQVTARRQAAPPQLAHLGAAARLRRRLVGVEEAEVAAVADVRTLPEGAEGRQVVRADARHRVVRHRPMEPPPGQAGIDLEGEDVHLEQAVARQRAVHVPRHGAEVLPHHPGAGAVRLERQDGVELLGGVPHVDAVALVDAARDPEQPVELHHVVDAQHAGVGQVVAQDGAQVAVAVAALALRVDRVETPVLAEAEQRVRRCTDGGAAGEQLRLAPGVERRREDTERQVEVEAAGGVGGARHLLLGGELGVEMEAVGGAVVGVGIEGTVGGAGLAHRLGPLLPGER